MKNDVYFSIEGETTTEVISVTKNCDNLMSNATYPQSVVKNRIRSKILSLGIGLWKVIT